SSIEPPGTEAAPDAIGTSETEGLPRGAAREPPVSRMVQRSTESSIEPPGTEAAPDAIGTSEAEASPRGAARPRAAAEPLQRRPMGQRGPVADVRHPAAPDMAGAEIAPSRGLEAGRARRTEAVAHGEREDGPMAVPFVSPRSVLQTRPVEQTAILPQIRRPSAPSVPAQGAQRRAQEPLPPLGQRAPLPADSGATTGSHVAPAPVVPRVTVRPPPQLSGQATIQRQPSARGAASTVSRADAGETAVVQRAAEDESYTEEQIRDEKQDLDRLAREVYPLVKRLLAVERERRTGRWR
ncbi:MAG TPA: hypothetical protein VM366_02435, partial [Anaerolineae bacterium]|nr:hypothetical protein [Anaerolineae bacterium]